MGAGGCGPEEGARVGWRARPHVLLARSVGPWSPECAIKPRCPLTRWLSSVVRPLSSVRRTRACRGYLPGSVRAGRNGRPGVERGGAISAIRAPPRIIYPAPGWARCLPALSRWLPPPAFRARSLSPRQAPGLPSLPRPLGRFRVRPAFFRHSNDGNCMLALGWTAFSRGALHALSDLLGSPLLHFPGAWVSVFPFCFNKEPRLG